jgi:hypothetical protein
MRAGETELQMCIRHVAEQEARIARQEILIERLRKIGSPLLDDARSPTAGRDARLLGIDARARGEAFLNFRLTNYPAERNP